MPKAYYDRERRGRVYLRRAIQTREMRTSNRNVPQIIAVATTIAVGKLIGRPPFRLTCHTVGQALWFRARSTKLARCPP